MALAMSEPAGDVDRTQGKKKRSMASAGLKTPAERQAESLVHGRRVDSPAAVRPAAPRAGAAPAIKKDTESRDISAELQLEQQLDVSALLLETPYHACQVCMLQRKSW